MKKIIEQVIAWWFKLVGLLPHSQTIYFESFHGKQYSDNPKAIYEYIKKEYPNASLCWGVTKGYEKPFLNEKVSYVSRFSLKWFWLMPRAKAWVMNTRTPSWLVKHPKTAYIQTWHGTPLKKIGVDIDTMNIPGYTQENYINEFTIESKRWDTLPSSGPFTDEVFKQAFRYSGPLASVGYPRNDQLVHAARHTKKVAELKEQLGIEADTPVVLYAPTWRESEKQTNGQYAFTTPFPFERLAKSLDKKIVLLVRMHYLVAQSFSFDSFDGTIINVSEGYDMSDLLLISDCLITDYSSCLFDFSLLHRPMIYYMPDKETYAQDLRGFYMDPEATFPGIFVTTQTELIGAINDWLNQKEEPSMPIDTTFKETYTAYETGNAAKYFADWLMGGLKG